MDTHTAVAKAVYKKYCQETSDKTKTIITATAHPFKFPKTVGKALGIKEQAKTDKEWILLLASKTGIAIPKILHHLDGEKEQTLWLAKDSYQNLEKLLGDIDEKN